jgi:hypothetical protein
VIFTDPIFQGMAISLSSGVLVSTILTLIVIPLGCVAASKDLCEVAVASAPPGVTVPCAEGIPDPQQSAKRAVAPRGGGKLAPAFSKIGNVLILILYAIRGIFLLLFDWIKGMIKRRKPRPDGGTGGGAPGGGGAGPTGGGPGAAGAGRDAAEDAVLPNALRRSPAPGPAVPAADSAGPVGAAEGTALSTADSKGSKVSEKPSRGSATKTSTRSKAGSTRARAPAARSSAGVAAAKVQKKSPRRGIRLKTGDSDGGGA